MDTYQAVMLAEHVERERQEQAHLDAKRWYLNIQPVADSNLRESLAGSLIALARWLSPQHTALTAQRQ